MRLPFFAVLLKGKILWTVYLIEKPSVVGIRQQFSEKVSVFSCLALVSKVEPKFVPKLWSALAANGSHNGRMKNVYFHRDEEEQGSIQH